MGKPHFCFQLKYFYFEIWFYYTIIIINNIKKNLKLKTLSKINTNT